MIKQFCDLCDKEITNEDYVEQSIFIHYDFNNSIDSIICKSCWEKEESNLNKLKEVKQQ